LVAAVEVMERVGATMVTVVVLGVEQDLKEDVVQALVLRGRVEWVETTDGAIG
jgi:hypothetical protein